MEYYLSVKRNEIRTRTTGFMNPEIFKWKKPDTKDHILYDSIHMKYPDMLVSRGRKQISGCQGPRKREEWEVTTYWVQGLLWE